MKPRLPSNLPQEDLFRMRLDRMLDAKHPLYKLSRQIDWAFFEKEFGADFSDQGRPALSTRLMVGLSYLKYLYDVSDEDAVSLFVENPYWQFFCGLEYFSHEFPCDPSSQTRWRKRMGPEKLEKLISETLRLAKENGALRVSQLKRVIADTTVQEKNIEFPIDARLYHRARERLVTEAEKLGVELRQSYRRLAKETLHRYSRYAHAKQFKRAKRAQKKLRTWLGRVIRDVERKLPERDQKMHEILNIARRIHEQKRGDSNKIYSVHAPEVECISKGKAHKRYEFGCKVGLVATVRGNWILGSQAFHGNQYDGKTLAPALAQAERITGVEIEYAFLDKGYRGSDHHPEGVSCFISGKKRLLPYLKRLLKRRSAIEPLIGHTKSGHRLGRNYLKGEIGDQTNPILAGAALNLKKLVGLLLFCLQIFAQNKSRSRISIPATA